MIRILLPLCIVLTGCANTTVIDPKIWGQSPDASNAYTGVLVAGENIPRSDVEISAREACERYGGISGGPTKDGAAPIGVAFWRFGCNGFKTQNHQSPASNNLSQPLPLLAPSKISAPDGSLEEYKRKCQEIGFEPNTQAFGNCVLRLSR